MIQKIVESGNPILREKSIKVARVDKKIRQLITDLKDTLAAQKDPEGVGLAAPQIGKNIRNVSYELRGGGKNNNEPRNLVCGKNTNQK